MGVESEGEEEVVALSDGEVDLLEHEGAADAEDDEALILSDEEEDEAEGADGEVRSGGVGLGHASRSLCSQSPTASARWLAWKSGVCGS